MNNDLVSALYSFIVDQQELKQSILPVNRYFDQTYQTCFQEHENNRWIKSHKHLEIESILDFLHDELNTGHWSEISVEIRRAFTAASFVKVIIKLQSEQFTHDILRDCLKTLDMGLLIGAPLEINLDLLTNSATFITHKLDTFDENKELKIFNKKRKLKYSINFENVKGVTVDTKSCPSLETFSKKYFSTKIPLKIQDCISHWPALTKWVDVNYLLKVAGERTVPIEIGSHYADENWCQKLMTLKDFIKLHFFEECENKGYLAQHNLFNQIPELRNDIYIPEYCCLSDNEESDEPDINAWFGPAGTVSPLHYDPKNNILVQVFGTKYLILYSPDDSQFLYPHDSMLLSNTAQVDPFKPDLQKYPNFEKASAYKCVLEAGDMLYIPPKWWHHVTAVDKSFSVSFWWN